MSNSFKDIIKAAKTVRLTDVEKARSREAIHKFMAANPMQPAGAGAPAQPEPQARRGLLPQFNFPWSLAPSLAVAVLAIVLVGGGITLAAQKSLPGDALYPVKVGVLEPLRSVLTFSATAKVQLEADLAAQRLDEAQQLIVKHKLTSTSTQELQANFNAHVDRAAAELQALAGTHDKQEVDELGSQAAAKLRHRRDEFISVSATSTLPAAATLSALPQASSTQSQQPVEPPKDHGHEDNKGKQPDFIIPVTPAIQKLEDAQAHDHGSDEHSNDHQDSGSGSVIDVFQKKHNKRSDSGD